MDGIWTELYDAAMGVIRPREISHRIEAGGVGAAVEAASGKIYVGVSVEAACALGGLCRAQRHLQHAHKRRG